MSFRKFCFLFCSLLVIIAYFFLERVCHLQTDGFSVLRIEYPLQQPPENLPSPLITSILSQKFTYLDSGAQSYVFVSEDNQYVIKFFKFHHMRLPPWAHYIPPLASLQGVKQEKQNKKDRVITKLFESYRIAYHLLKEETGLVYLHLQPTSGLPSIELIDTLGIHYLLKPDDLAFALQHRGRLFYDVVKESNLLQAQEAIFSILQLCVLRCQRGVGDKDPDFCTNFGWIAGKAVQLDTGRFYLEEEEKKREVYVPELYRITEPFRVWLTTHRPALVSFLDEQLQQLAKEDLAQDR